MNSMIGTGQIGSKLLDSGFQGTGQWVPRYWTDGF